MAQYFIWSHRHDQWWGPDRGGYTNNYSNAGLYSKVDAADITFNCLPGANIAVPAELVHSHFSGSSIDEIKAELEVWRRI